jgi:cbb3-type cytochrome oxidase maturation protein
MISILYLIPISIGLGLCGLLGFFWSVKSRQYDNLESDAMRVLNAKDRPMSDAECQAIRDPTNRV